MKLARIVRYWLYSNTANAFKVYYPILVNCSANHIAKCFLILLIKVLSLTTSKEKKLTIENS